MDNKSGPDVYIEKLRWINAQYEKISNFTILALKIFMYGYIVLGVLGTAGMLLENYPISEIRLFIAKTIVWVATVAIIIKVLKIFFNWDRKKREREIEKDIEEYKKNKNNR